MDFGRKGDNKRAMKLMWSSGMSLKDAWSVVQGRKKGTRKSSSRKNCFGAIVPDGYEINPGTGRMRKICEYGRNPTTGKCNPGPRIVKPGPAGYEYNPDTGKYRKMCEHGRNLKTGRCLPATKMYAMREGYEINPDTGRLRKICTYGRNALTGRCFTRPMDQTLAPPMGYEYAPSGKLRKICLYGRDPDSGRCLGKPRLRPVGIPEGYEINPITGRYRKLCPDNYYRNPRGVCVKMGGRRSMYEDAIDMPGTNPFDEDAELAEVERQLANLRAADMNSAAMNATDDDDDYDPFTALGFGKRGKKYNSRSRNRSCFGTCTSCNYI